MTGAVPTADAATVRAFVETIHSAAAAAFQGAERPGLLQLVQIHPAAGGAVSFRFPIGDVERMVDQALLSASTGHNVYVEARTVSEAAKWRGVATDTRGVFAFVIDADADKGKAGHTSARPSITVETSPGNAHRWFFLNRALTAEQARPIGAAIRAAVGADADTGVITQPYRVAGTPNYPGKTKLARGRVATPTRVLEQAGKVWSADELQAVFPVREKLKTHQAEPRQAGASGRTSARVEQFAAEVGNDRSARFHAAVKAGFVDGLTIDDLEALMRQHPDGCGGKYLKPSDRLRGEIERSWSKAEAHAAKMRQAGEQPFYEDASRPIEEAREAVEATVRRFLDAAEAHRLAGRQDDEPPVHALAVSTGVGKTHAAAQGIAEYIKARRAAGERPRPVLYAVPTHRLGDEIVAQFAAHGIAARVFRGRQAPDPARPGQAMCDDLEAVEIALSIGAVVSTSCCKAKMADGTEAVCQHFAACAYQAQKADEPDIWIVSHQMLFQAQTALGKVGLVIIDEGFWQAGIRIPKRGLTLNEIEAPVPFGKARDDAWLNDVESARAKLARALRRQDGVGGVRRQHLLDEGVTAELCTNAIAAEWRFKEAAPIWPGMPKAERRRAAEAAAGTKHIRAFVALWAAARDVLDDDTITTSGRLYLEIREDEDGRVLVAKARSVKAIAKQWRKPTLLLDATQAAPEILGAFYPQVETALPIEAAMPHVRVRQVLDAPVSATKLKLDDEGAPRRNLRAIRRAILLRFLELGRAPLLVIAQKRTAEWLRASGLPAGISTEHFNAIAGLDQYRYVRGLMIIGRTLPQAAAVEALAGALTGRQPLLNEGRYPHVARGIRKRDGSPRAVECAIHLDPAAEACRWQICEGELMQAIGRGRGVNRTAETPLAIDVIANVCLPLTIDEVVTWSPPDDDVEMLIEGVVLHSAADMAAIWPEVWPTPGAARNWLYRRAANQTHSVTEPYKEGSYIGFCDAVAFRYRRPGARQKWRTGVYDPAVVADLKAWLESRLGSLAGFEILKSAASTAPPPKLQAATYEPDLTAQFRGVVDVRLALKRPAPVKAEVVRWRLPLDDEPICWPPAIRAVLAAVRLIRLEAAE